MLRRTKQNFFMNNTVQKSYALHGLTDCNKKEL
uniref:Uncharacterized protein n=1 Tax=Arundo donax TaxID=35708 RepID=A0A0A9CC98_ARUDO